MSEQAQTNRIRAPELDGVQVWINAPRPIRLRELRGCVVVLDFWTYCCINCLHVLAVLARVERRLAGKPFAVIGIHSGKFDAERDPDRIRQAVARYGVSHPVAVDEDFSLWQRYAIRSWPTLVVIRPDGSIAAVAPGEPDQATLLSFLWAELRAGHLNGTLVGSAPEWMMATPPTDSGSTDGPLRFPGKVTALPDGRLLISDSGHHRLLLAGPDGRVLATIGRGEPGFDDGSWESARFDDPQGTCLHTDGAVYVADVRNHAVCRVDLTDRRISTVAGTGRMAATLPAAGTPALPARATMLRSPWDVASLDGALWVAMAGNHQIWRLCPESDQIEPVAGTGAESMIDGVAPLSTWAQPSGLSVAAPGLLWVADSESSAVRLLDVRAGSVRTLVGAGLFDFGDRDGPLGSARLQHPLAVAADPGGVLIADTYNGKLKRLDPVARTVATLAEGLSEPGGLARAADGTVWVADTNAHRVVRWRPIQSDIAAHADTAPTAAWEPLTLLGAAPLPSVDSQSTEMEGYRADESLLTLGTPVLSPATAAGWFTHFLTLPRAGGLTPGPARVHLGLLAPAGFKFADGSTVRWSAEVSRRSDLLRLLSVTGTAVPTRSDRTNLPIAVELVNDFAETIEAELVLTADSVLCRVSGNVCLPGRLHLRVPVRLWPTGSQVNGNDFELTLPVPVAAGATLEPPPTDPGGPTRPHP